MSLIKKQIILKVSNVQPLRRMRLRRDIFSRNFNYNLDFSTLDFRKEPSFYRVGTEETGVLVVQPYACQLKKIFKFENLKETKMSAADLMSLFKIFSKQNDFIGMDMTRKYVQMGLKLSQFQGLKSDRDARGEVFKEALTLIEATETYVEARIQWKDLLG